MQLSDEQKEALGRIKALCPHLLLAINSARLRFPDFDIKLGILAVNPKNESGQIVASFFADDFMNDLRKLAEFDKELEREIEKIRKVNHGKT